MGKFYLRTISNYSIILFALSSISVASCNKKVYISHYSTYNTIDINNLQTFDNYSLKFSIDFWGRNHLQQLGTRKKYAVPDYCIAILKKMGIRKEAKLLLYFKPGIKKYAQASYGFIVDKASLTLDTMLFSWDKTIQGDSYFIARKWYKSRNTTSAVGGFEIGTKYIFLVESQSLLASSEWDSLGQLGNTKGQLLTLLKGEKRISFLKARKSLLKTIDSNMYSLNYLTPILELKKIPADTIEKYSLDHYYYQYLATRISYLDNLNSINEMYGEYRYAMRDGSSASVPKANLKIKDEDAIKKVCEIAKTQKMLMINESHYDYRHRLFVTLLLDSLYKIGYRNLCVEDRKTTSTVNNLFPQKEDGSYILEPFMAGLIRRAKEIGFNVYGYDTKANSFEEREYGQGKNLYNLYTKDSHSKWLVLAGYSHINKQSFMDGIISAQQHFTKLAGFSPYSINQSSFSDITNENAKVDIPKIGYYVVDTSSSVYKKGQSDLYIINNIRSHPYEKPFGSIEPSLKKYILKVPVNVIGNAIIFLYVKKELELLHHSAIPVYIGKVEKNKDFVLYLPENQYSYIVTDSAENQIANGQLVFNDKH